MGQECGYGIILEKVPSGNVNYINLQIVRRSRKEFISMKDNAGTIWHTVSRKDKSGTYYSQNSTYYRIDNLGMGLFEIAAQVGNGTIHHNIHSSIIIKIFNLPKKSCHCWKKPTSCPLYFSLPREISFWWLFRLVLFCWESKTRRNARFCLLTKT